MRQLLFPIPGRTVLCPGAAGSASSRRARPFGALCSLASLGRGCEEPQEHLACLILDCWYGEFCSLSYLLSVLFVILF